jgi:hypothetical protein
MLSYRQIVPGDRDFRVETHHLAMRPYVEALWGWDEFACAVKDAKGG